MKGKSRSSQEIQEDIDADEELRELASKASSLTGLKYEKFTTLVWQKQRKILRQREVPVLQRGLRKLRSRMKTYKQENSPAHQAWVKAYEQAIEEKKQEAKKGAPSKAKQRTLKHKTIKREVQKLLRGKSHIDMDEKFNRIAEKLGMSFEAVKKDYYYRGKR
jgi:gas vesicle protein